MFEIAEPDDAVGTIEIWQLGSFIQASVREFVGEYRKALFATPDHGEMFERVEGLHEISREPTDCALSSTNRGRIDG
jgi:hypothetical protein